MADLIEEVKKNYIEKIINIKGGMKALIVDSETVFILIKIR